MTWVPFAFMGEEINRLSDPGDGSHRHHNHYNRLSTDTARDEEEQYRMIDMTLSRPSLGGIERPSVPALMDAETDGDGEAGNELSGIYLGILNVFACLPQFVSTFISFVVFSILEPGKSPEFADGGEVGGDGQVVTRGGANAIAVVMALGGLSVLLAAHYTVRYKGI